jgi:hypothetical protein
MPGMIDDISISISFSQNGTKHGIIPYEHCIEFCNNGIKPSIGAITLNSYDILPGFYIFIHYNTYLLEFFLNINSFDELHKSLNCQFPLQFLFTNIQLSKDENSQVLFSSSFYLTLTFSQWWHQINFPFGSILVQKYFQNLLIH